MTDRQQVRVDDAIGGHQVVHGHAETLGNGVESVASLHNVHRACPLRGGRVGQNENENGKKKEETLPGTRVSVLAHKTALRPDLAEPKRRVADLSARLTAAADQHFRDGNARLREGNIDAARREFLLSLASDPDHAKSLEALQKKYLNIADRSALDRVLNLVGISLTGPTG